MLGRKPLGSLPWEITGSLQLLKEMVFPRHLLINHGGAEFVPGFHGRHKSHFGEA